MTENPAQEIICIEETQSRGSTHIHYFIKTTESVRPKSSSPNALKTRNIRRKNAAYADSTSIGR